MHPLVSKILISRGISSQEKARRFLNPSLDDLHSPFCFKEMKKALSRLETAKEENERVLVHGDFDADGITGTALLVATLRRAGLNADYFIPDRFSDGYGFGKAGVDAALNGGCRLIVTVDCGITDIGAVADAAFKGIDVIITDHHQPVSAGLPDAFAVINPILEDSGYPERLLSGAIVSLKLCQAVIETFELNLKVESLLKLAAVGTVADIVPLKGENRTVVKYGLKGLSDPRSPGLSALLDVCGLNGKKITASDIGFKIGPRLNASGRMGSAKTAVDLFLTSSTSDAEYIADGLNRSNSERQKAQKILLDKIVGKTGKTSGRKSIVVWGTGWHKGILGLAAQKLKDSFNLPCIVINIEKGLCRGSCRGVDGMNLVEALGRCEGLLEKYGGHNYAAGLEIKEEKLENFSTLFDSVAREMLKDKDPEPVLNIDCCAVLKEINPDLVKSLSELEPHGMGNPRPVFASKGIRVCDKPRLMNGKHLAFRVEQDRARQRVIYWNGAEFAKKILKADKIAFSLKKDTYRPEGSFYLELKDFK